MLGTSWVDMSCIGGWNGKVGSESPVAVYAENGTAFANVGVALVTARTLPAGKMALDGHMITDGMGRHSFAKGYDAPAGFVAGDGPQWNIVATPLIPLPNM
jgi:hypothetical protein